MTQEEKQLLLIDLCARVPYRTFVCLNPGAYNKPETCILTGVHGEKVHLNVDSDPFRVDHIKPYLRPLSSMTEKEKKEHNFYCGYKPYDENIGESYLTEYDMPDYMDFLYEHHLDFRGLIPMGLALEAKEGMYKTE